MQARATLLARPLMWAGFVPALLLELATLSWAAPSWAGALETSQEPVLIVDGVAVYRGTTGKEWRGSGGEVFSGDTYSFEHQVGAMIGNSFQCFSPHASGTTDNTVLFDGLSELLDPYTDGTQPFVFEFETSSSDGTTVTATLESGASGDLFPEGFEDPETGTPLDSACVEIGIDDTLDIQQQPSSLERAALQFTRGGDPFLGSFDITSFFADPFDGRLSIVFSTLTGADIDGVTLSLEMTSPDSIFSDGFESGDASAWTDSSP